MSADPHGCADSGLQPQAVDDVITFLNLNCERLRLARQTARRDTTEWYVQLLNEILDGTHLGLDQREQLMELAVAGRLQPGPHGHLRAWWTTLREALGPPGDRWVSSNLAALNY